MSPPTAKDGSKPQCCRTTMSIDVVVVLPCVPVTISVRVPAISLASTAGRRITGIDRRWASTNSGLVFGMAAWVVMTAVGPPGSRSRWAASWPMLIRAPRARNARTPRDSLASEPDTIPPRSSRIRAIPDIPAPPIPTIWTRWSSGGNARERVIGGPPSEPARRPGRSRRPDARHHGDLPPPPRRSSRPVGHRRRASGPPRCRYRPA